MVARELVSLSIVLLLVTSEVLSTEDHPASRAKVRTIEFERDVAPILREKCIDCHGPTMEMADLRLDEKQLAMESGESGGSIVPGSSQDSYLIQRLHDKDEGIIMPPTGRLLKNEVDILRDWIDQGAVWPDDATLALAHDVKETDPMFRALFRAIRQHDRGALRQLLDSEPSLAHVADGHGSTPLMYATLYGHADGVKLLLDRGADPNHADSDGATALMWGARSKRIVGLLLEHGAHVNARSKFGRTPLMIAAAHAGNVRTVEMLLNAGADVAEKDDRKAHALILAVATGDCEIVHALNAAGADVRRSEKDADGEPSWGAIAAAAFLNDMPMVRLILQHDVRGPVLDKALSYAARNGSAEMVELLLDAGADVKRISDSEGEPGTALIAAAYSDYQNNRVMDLLLRHGADPSVRDARDRTAFDYALRRGRTEASDLLARPQTRVHRTAREAAEKSIKLLQSSGTTFFRKSGCVACHQHTVTSIALEQARRTGVSRNEAAAAEQLKISAMVQAGRRSRFLQRVVTGGAGHTVGYILLGMAAEGYPADETTDACAMELSGLQTADGSWFSHAHRPPTEYSRISATTVSVRAMQLYAPPGLRDDFASQVAKARDWLVRTKPTSNQEYAFRLLGLKWTGADSKDIRHAADVLIAQQQPDGGWQQLPGMQTDAYATGLTMYALHVGRGIAGDDSAYRRGAEFLLRTQHADGSWHVRSRSYKFQPYFESGFPHHHDQWISSAATGWAATALMLPLDTS